MTKNKYLLVTEIFFILIILLSSCIVDIPTPASNPYNDTQVVISPVNNYILSDSLKSLINFYSTTFLNSEKVIVTQNIIDSKYHIAFTDLIKYKNNWYIAFRFSDGHMPKDFAHIIIIKSKDLKEWTSEQIFIQAGYDLRDPKFFIKEDKLYIHFHSVTISPYGESRNDYVAKYIIENSKWAPAVMLNKNTKEKSWFWRLTENDGKLYTIAYFGREPLKLYESNDSVNFTEIHRFEELQGRPSEATLRFYNDTVFAIIRKDEDYALLGKSSILDLTQWEFDTLPWIKFGGPNFLIYKDNLIITGRVNSIAKVYKYSLSSKILQEIATLPGGINEMGYCGMCIENDYLNIVYYTGIKSGGYCINFSRVNLESISFN